MGAIVVPPLASLGRSIPCKPASTYFELLTGAERANHEEGRAWGTEADEAGEAGVRVETPVWNLSLPRDPNDVVFFTVSALGLTWVLWRIVDRLSGSGALLISALLPVLILYGYLIRAFSARLPSGEPRPKRRRRALPAVRKTPPAS